MKIVKRLIPAAALFLSLGALAGCETYGGTYSEGYYDNYYGPVNRGYWADDGYFYYRTHRDRVYIRDESRHFRRDHHDGYQHYRVRGDRHRH